MVPDMHHELEEIICQLLEKHLHALHIDQLIWEKPGSSQWVHIGIAIPPGKPRHQVLTIDSSGTYNGLRT